jgi:hypothetical protein
VGLRAVWPRPALRRWSGARSCFRWFTTIICRTACLCTPVVHTSAACGRALTAAAARQTGRMSGRGVGDTLRAIYQSEGARGCFRCHHNARKRVWLPCDMHLLASRHVQWTGLLAHNAMNIAAAQGQWRQRAADRAVRCRALHGLRALQGAASRCVGRLRQGPGDTACRWTAAGLARQLRRLAMNKLKCLFFPGWPMH